MVPASTLLIHSYVATNVALVVLFWVAAWNGASFYVEVFGRKFERELEKLRKEMEASMSSSGSAGSTGGPTPSQPGTPFSPLSAAASADTNHNLDHSPLVLPAPDVAVPVLDLSSPDKPKPKSE